jgi:hypothetical protein
VDEVMRPGSRSGRFLPPLAAALLLGGYGFFLVRSASFSVGGSDSSGYLNTARRLAEGNLVGPPRGRVRFALPDEFLQVFIPLGFVRGPRPGTMAPYYPPGFPAHMAAAASLLGWERGPFLVSPLASLLCLLLFYLLARQLSLSRAWAASATTVFAFWPVLLGQAIQPMSDTAATFWALAAVLCGLRARGRTAWALGCGAALGIAVLVRPANLLLAVPLAFALPITLRALGLLVAGGLPFAAVLAAYDLECYGSALQTGYGKSGFFDSLSLRNAPPRLRHYGGWILRSLTPLVPLAWIGLAADRKIAWRDRMLLLSWFAMFFLFYCLYEPYDSFWFVRFLLPAAPGLILGGFVAARDASERLGRAASASITAAALVLILLAEAWTTRKAGVFLLPQGESVYPEACAWAARTLPSKSVVLCVNTSGAMEHYTNLTYARLDWIERDRFPDLRRRIEGAGGRWFALLFRFEAEDLTARAPGQWRKIGQLRDIDLWKLEAD